MGRRLQLLLLAVALAARAAAKELTFEMDEHSTQCFYQDLTPGQPVTVEHEVRGAGAAGPRRPVLTWTGR